MKSGGYGSGFERNSNSRISFNKVLITIRQEVIKILEELKEEYDNVFKGKIVNLKNRNNIISIVIDIGIPINLYTMDYELVERIKSKSIVFIRIPIESINVINL